MNTHEESKFSSPETESSATETPGAEAPGAGTQTESEPMGTGAPQSKALIDELNVLGAKFAEAIDAAWKSEQRKRLEDDLRTGVTGVAHSLEQHLKEFSKREEARKVLDKAEDVADKVRSSKVSYEIATALTQGLRSLSDQLDKFAQELRERETGRKSDAQDSPDSSARTDDATNSEDIPIERG